MVDDWFLEAPLYCGGSHLLAAGSDVPLCDPPPQRTEESDSPSVHYRTLCPDSPSTPDTWENQWDPTWSVRARGHR